ncbi:MAG: glycoside hydrolase family 32 protein [Tetrasphaera sp.]|nr:glycoside hydrolase family 32 protein [Tetrasphaera sp.]
MTHPNADDQVLPVYHLRPARGWVNDPNGMTYHDGRWHVFFQHHSGGPFHHLIEWGHASSADLIHWREHPIAFGPTPEGPDRFGCWTGVFVPGLQRPAVAYSGVVDESLQTTTLLRWGSDDLDRWSEPEIVARTPTTDGVRIMRDPFVFVWGGRRWALTGAGLESGAPALLIYGADDPLSWTYAGLFYTGPEPAADDRYAADIWECPQLLLTEDAAVLVVSLQLDGVLGDVLSIVGQVVDDAGVPRFVAVWPDAARLLDLGDSYYAPQLVADPQGPGALMIGWVRQDGLPQETHKVAGCLSLPRRLALRDGGVVVQSDEALASLQLGDYVDATGDGSFPEHCLVETSAATVELAGSLDNEIRTVVVHPGDRAWIDAGVVEVYPETGMPRTLRADPGTWRISSGRAQIRPVLTISMS